MMMDSENSNNPLTRRPQRIHSWQLILNLNKKKWMRKLSWTTSETTRNRSVKVEPSLIFLLGNNLCPLTSHKLLHQIRNMILINLRNINSPSQCRRHRKTARINRIKKWRGSKIVVASQASRWTPWLSTPAVEVREPSKQRQLTQRRVSSLKSVC